MVEDYTREGKQMSFKMERNNQPHADNYYESRAWVIDRKHHTEASYDLDLDSVPTEEKFREGDFGDLLVEMIQCMVDIGNLTPKALGWFYTEKFDRLHYFTGCDPEGKRPPKKLYVIANWPAFKKWLYLYLAQAGQVMCVFSPKGYGLTMNIPIKWYLIDDKVEELELRNTCSTQ